jgi:hypothetical protein
MQYTVQQLLLALIICVTFLSVTAQGQTCSPYFQVTSWTSFLPQMTHISSSYRWYVSGGTLVSGNTGVQGSSSIFDLTVPIVGRAGGRFTFEYYVSAESCCDKLLVTANGSQIVYANNAAMWTTYTMNLPYGITTFRFSYSKDSSVDSGADMARIRLVRVEDSCQTACVGTTICSSHGTCFDNRCVCDNGYTGIDCATLANNTCNWNTNAFGAPRPAVNVHYNSNYLIFDVSMTNHPTNVGVVHFISTVPYTGNFSLFQVENNYASQDQFLSGSDCTNSYGVALPWTSPTITKVYSSVSNTMQLTAKLYMHYINREEKTVVSFEFVQQVSANFVSDAVTVFNTTESQVLTWTVQYIYPQNGVILIGATMVVLPGYNISQLKMLWSNLNVPFDITFSRASAPDTYDVKLMSRNGLSSATGSYRLTTLLSYNGLTTNLTVPFEIVYDIIVPPAPVNLIYNTDVFLSDAEYGPPQNSYGYGDRVYALTALRADSPVLASTQALVVRNAYLCCMKNTSAMPAYNPSSGNYGCTVNNPTTMDKWIQLVNNRVASTITTVYPRVISDRVMISFDANPLVDKNRVCYLHMNTVVSPTGARSVHADEEDEESHSFSFFKVEQNDDMAITSSATRTLSFSVCLLIIALVSNLLL